jgi:hypothetical protein
MVKDQRSRPFPVAVQIYGRPGVGKTQIVLEYLHRNKSRYSSILWIDSQTRSSIETSISKIARMLAKQHVKRTTLGLNQDIAQDSVSMSSIASTASWVDDQVRKQEQGLPLPPIELVKAWLAKSSNQRWIMIFDGADNCKSLQLEKYFPDTKHGLILLTSRHCDFPKWSKGLELGPMDENEATRLLYYSCPTWRGPDGKNAPILNLSSRSQITDLATDESIFVQELVKQLECLPLSIVQAGAYIKSTGMTVSGYLSRFRDAKPHQWTQYELRISKTPLITMNEIFTKSYRDVEQKDPEALRLLNLCSFLAPNSSIPGKVLESGAQVIGEYFFILKLTICID